ncbi:MAG: tRNA uridine-5-carboxymethylaminomethyl(34) synthesis GTPase MnmE [Candidatus Hydrogenedens sp.]
MGCKSRDDTITAICTPPGVGAIGVIRVSGPDAIHVVSSIARSRAGQNITMKKRGLYYGYIVDENEKILDDVILLTMKSPHSYTGEDVVEIHAHGNMLILRGIIDLLLKKGVRIAEPGEFTKRAFLNGKIDLTQAEGVIDQITAKTKKSLELSREILEGHLSKKIYEYSEHIKTILAWVEAVIDFPEEEIPDKLWQQSLAYLQEILISMKRLLSTSERGKILREGVITAIAGKPNVGKSSLFNALLQENRAIVSPYPGTTRDHLEEYASLGGVPVRLIDTAGLRDVTEPVEKEGIERAWKAIENAHIILFVIDATNINKEDIQLYLSLKKNTNKILLLIVNKTDLNKNPDIPPLLTEDVKSIIYTSAKTGEGLDTLEKEIVTNLLGEQEISGDIILTREHQKDSLLRAYKCIQNCIHQKELSPELIAFELREALHALGEITGETAPEELLDIIFSSFCIGK